MGLINFLVFYPYPSLPPLHVVAALVGLCTRLKHPFDFSSATRNEYLSRLHRLAFWVAAFYGLWLSVG